MVMLQNIPKVSEGCAANGAEEKYTLVASFPPDTSCSGPDGACLVMCKAEVSMFDFNYTLQQFLEIIFSIRLCPSETVQL